MVSKTLVFLSEKLSPLADQANVGHVLLKHLNSPKFSARDWQWGNAEKLKKGDG